MSKLDKSHWQVQECHCQLALHFHHCMTETEWLQFEKMNEYCTSFFTMANNGAWSLYSELCCCLSKFVGLPIFTLFLSTAGKFHLFSPPRLSDYSSRVVLGANWVLPPITETGFDQFTLDAKEGKITLDRVVEVDWICSLGRPLYVFLAHAFW